MAFTLIDDRNYLSWYALICSPPAIERLSSGLFQEVIITNTIPISEKNYFPQLTVLSVANLLGESIWRVHDDYPVSIAKLACIFPSTVHLGTESVVYRFCNYIYRGKI